MTEFVARIQTVPLNAEEPDGEAVKQFMRNHPGVFLNVVGDGSIRGKVHVHAQSEAVAWTEARGLFLAALDAGGRRATEQSIESHEIEAIPDNEAGATDDSV